MATKNEGGEKKRSRQVMGGGSRPQHKRRESMSLNENRVKKESRPRVDLSNWVPSTRLGSLVKSEKLKTLHDALKFPEPIREIEIVDKLLPGLQEEIISVGRVQRVTDSGRRMRFRIVVIVGNENGYVGVGQAKGKEAGPTIRKAIEKAKLGIKEIKRGCGSWECGCGTPHTVPYTTNGKAGSVRVSLYPAPRGTGIVAGEIPKKILSLAGVKDVYIKTKGHTRTSLNFTNAIIRAIAKTTKIKISDRKVEEMGVVLGPGQIIHEESDTQIVAFEEQKEEKITKE